MEPTPLGQLLWQENSRSVAYRYHEAPDELTYTHTLSDGHRALVRDPWTVLKLCRGYAYQACEHPGWETSQACAIAEALEAQRLQQLGLTALPHTHPRYLDAPWGIA
jgi:hypothetical protein